MQTFSDQERALRGRYLEYRRRGATFAMLEESTGVSASTLQKWLTGDRPLGTLQLCDLVLYAEPYIRSALEKKAWSSSRRRVA